MALLGLYGAEVVSTTKQRRRFVKPLKVRLHWRRLQAVKNLSFYEAKRTITTIGLDWIKKPNLTFLFGKMVVNSVMEKSVDKNRGHQMLHTE